MINKIGQPRFPMRFMIFFEISAFENLVFVAMVTILKFVTGSFKKQF